ncbi:MAG: hypothetical protein LW860_17750 [Xanthomonadaceae bacterium]|jgi:hypothetical protein|nr:hypothetical protein [Xanthomonadaceae bacterium]
MRTLQLTFLAIAASGSVLMLSARFQELDVDDLDEGNVAPEPMPALITCAGRVFEPADDGSYRARDGGTVLRARDPRFGWPRLQRLAELALGHPLH